MASKKWLDMRKLTFMLTRDTVCSDELGLIWKFFKEMIFKICLVKHISE